MKKVFGKRTDERVAALAGTRQMIAEDQFDAIVALLVDSGAVSRTAMSVALFRLSEQMTAKARGEVECTFVPYPAELMHRARELSEQSLSICSR